MEQPTTADPRVVLALSAPLLGADAAGPRALRVLRPPTPATGSRAGPRGRAGHRLDVSGWTEGPTARLLPKPVNGRTDPGVDPG